MISPYLHDFWPAFLLIFSPLEIADFLMLFKPSGVGYSLLCSKNSLHGTATEQQMPRYSRRHGTVGAMEQ
jgi:hypothetical protein